MAAVDVGARNNPPVPTDDLDDLFDYSVPADIFQDVDTNMEAPKRPAKAPLGDAGKENTGGLGLDEEIKVIKKRAPIPKLDEKRLLSSAGIPRLRTITKTKLKFKGKGHEYSDVARLLNVYQLWLDDLYPRAKFADGLAMIEKLGHKKQLQIMRKEWINEGKPKEKYSENEVSSEFPKRHQDSPSATQRPPSADDIVERPEEVLADDDWTDDDIFGPQVSAKAVKERKAEDMSKDSLFIGNGETGNDAPPEDDLDALLAENEANAQTTCTASREQNNKSRSEDVNFDDEMEVMAGLDDMW